MPTPVTDPKSPATKPHGTTEDQIKEMESEGQAQAPAETSTGRVESPSADRMEGAPGPSTSDQDIDTAGTEADDSPRQAGRNPNPDAHDRNVEEPGDTEAHDIVGRTGEQMPRQSHDGLEAEDRGEPAERDENERPAAGRVH